MLHLFQMLIVVLNGKCSWRRLFPAQTLAGGRRPVFLAQRLSGVPSSGMQTHFMGGIQYGENHPNLGNCAL